MEETVEEPTEEVREVRIPDWYRHFYIEMRNSTCKFDGLHDLCMDKRFRHETISVYCNTAPSADKLTKLVEERLLELDADDESAPVLQNLNIVTDPGTPNGPQESAGIVISYDCPASSEDYANRYNCTAAIGRKSIAIIFFTFHELYDLHYKENFELDCDIDIDPWCYDDEDGGGDGAGDGDKEGKEGTEGGV